MQQRPSAVRGLPITYYAAMMVLLVLLVLLGYGAYTFNAFQRVQSDLHASAHAAARDEVRAVIAELYQRARRAADQIAARDEVAERLMSPRDYAHGRGEPIADAGLMRGEPVAATIYDLDGVAVATAAGASSLPDRLDLPPPSSYVDDGSGPEPALLMFRTVQRQGDDGGLRPLGYVVLRIDLLQSVREGHAYRYVDAPTIRFVRGARARLDLSQMASALRFELRDNPMRDAVVGLLSDAIINLGVIIGVFALILFTMLAFLVVRPLRAISAHVDRLKDSPGGLILDDLANVLPIAETEKIRASLNDYQSQLVDVHSSLEEKSQELWVMAYYDALTGIRNRRAFDEYMKNLPQLLGDLGLGVCFVLFDVNHFKALNDTYGHSIGDQVLKVVAQRIGAALRHGEELFRIGGDEFAVLLLDCDQAKVVRIAERCHEKVVNYDFSRLGVREPLRVSAGLATARVGESEDLQALQWKADVAMYHAKRPGSPPVVVFDESLAHDSQGLFSSWVNTAVYEAVISGTGLSMHYQPIVDLEGGEICHYEALVRIEQDGQIIQPSNIFPVVEARRLEVELDRAVLRRVLSDLKSARVRPGTGVSINLSGPTLVNERVCDWLDAFRPYLKDYRVMIEVTETALITQIGLANENLSKLRQRGFEIALDDFGSGYSSLRYLTSMPVDVVKFDISLIHSLQDESQRVMVSYLAKMILESDQLLVAEGIEDVATLEASRAAGFNRGQGYLFGHPSGRADRVQTAFDNVTAFPTERRA